MEIIQEWASTYISSVAKTDLKDKNISRDSVLHLVDSAVKTDRHLLLLRLLYGAVGLLGPQRLETWNPDRIAELGSILSSCDAFRIQFILYPLLMAIDIGKEIKPETLVLKREATILSNTISYHIISYVFL